MTQCVTEPACRVITDAAALENLRPAWSALLERSGTNEPTLSPEWLLTWWRVFGGSQGRRLRVACFEENGRLIGLAPLLAKLSWYRRSVPFRRLEALGSGEDPTEAICSDYLSIIAERGAEEHIATRLARALVTKELGAWDEFVIPLMDGSGPMPTLLETAFSQAGCRAEIAVTTQAPYVPLLESWDAYLKALTKKHRQQLRYSLRDFDAWAGDTQRLESVQTPDQLEKGLAILIDLHKQRWHDPAEGGVFRAPRFNAFHHAILPQLLQAGALQLTWLAAHGRPVAAMYNIVWNNKIYFYQSGRDTNLPSHLRPGVVVIAKVLQQAIQAGRREFDFLGGASTYKMQLALATRPLVELRVTRPGVRESARRLLEAGAAKYRRVCAMFC